MGFRAGAYMKVWDIDNGENGYSVKGRLSHSYKKKDSDKYEQDFSGYCSFVGNAFEKAKILKEGDKIKLDAVDVTNKYDKEKKREYHTYKIFEFSKIENEEGTNKHSSPDTVAEDTEDSDLPF